MKVRAIRLPGFVIASAAALAASGAFVVLGGGQHGAGTVTVRGEILDMACYVPHEAQGADHQACAKRCVKDGQPMGLLAEDGTVYLLYAGHKDPSAFEQAKEHAGAKVEITGKKSSRAGVRGLEVQQVKPL